MANFARVEICDFENIPDQQDSLNTTDVRLPVNLSAQNFSTAGPLVLDRDDINYNVKGLHPYIETASAATAVLFSSSITPTIDAASFIRMRMFGGGTDFRAAPACRITSDGIGCYAAELIWVPPSTPGYFKLDIVRYDATTGTRNVLASVNNALTEYPASSGNFGNRFYAIGIQATGSGGTVTLKAFLQLLYFTETPSLATYWDLNGMPASQTAILTTTDTSGSRHVTGPQGIKWAAGTLTASNVTRIVNQWGCFVDIASTKPNTPTITANTITNGQWLTVAISGFVDTDPLDTHQATRWLLYSDQGAAGATFAYPIKDSGFSTGDLLSYTFKDLDPNQRYAVRVQVRDNDGDVSDFASEQSVEIAPTSSQHLGFLRSFRLAGRVAGNLVAANSGFIVTEPGAFTLSPIFKQATQAAGSGSSRWRTTRFGTVPASQHRIFSWRDGRYIGGGSNPLYDTAMGTMVFVQWPTGSGLYVQVRSTAADADAYFVKKQANGGNWEYLLYRRTLSAGGTPGPGSGSGPWTDTLLTTYSVSASVLGSNYGERIILAHTRDTTGVGTLTLFVNGVALTPAITNEQYGGNDPGHQWHSVRIDSTNGSWGIYQYGAVAPTLSFITTPNFVVYPEIRDGTGQYHDPGPLMDPFDFGTNNIWFQNNGKWQVKSATTAVVMLLYWAPYYTHYNTSVKAAILGNNGLIARFTDANNFIGASISGAGGTRTLTLTALSNAAVVLNVSASIAFVDGSEMILQTFNDANSNDILIRVYYNGSLVLPTSGVAQKITNGQSLALVQGRCGIGRASGLSGTTEDVASSFEVAEGISIAPPNTPTGTGLLTTACLKVSATLQSSAFSDPDASTHTASQWQVATYPAGSFASPLFDSGADATNLVAITVNTAIGTWSDPTNKGLDASTQYQYRVRHKDSTGLWSSWSTPVQFTTGAPSTTSPGSNVIATYPTSPPPSQVFTETANFRTLITPFESGREQRRAKQSRMRRSFTLRYEVLIGSQMDLFWDFYTQTAFGSLNVFNFIHPRTNEAILCRFLNDSMSRELFEADIEKTGLGLVEVFI